MKTGLFAYAALFILTAPALHSQSPQTLEWAQSFGGTGTEVPRGIATDAAGAVYTTGTFSGAVDFDPGASVTSLTATGNFSNLFVSKLDSTGALAWARAVLPTAAAGTSYGYALTVDAAGAVYVTGNFSGTVDFDPGAGTALLTATAPTSQIDAFALKLDAAGNYVWAARMGGAQDQSGNSIAVDATGAVYVSGFFNNTTDFDPGAGTFNITSTASSQDAFVVKLTPTGVFAWAKAFTGANTENCSRVCVSSGGVYACGIHYDATDFDPGPATATIDAQSTLGGFIVRLDTSGAFGWARGINGAGGAVEMAELTADASGALYATGSFSDTIDFDGGPAVSTLSSVSTGNFDGFVLKLNAAGAFGWVKRVAAGRGSDRVRGLAVDGAGRIHTSGTFGYSSGTLLDTADFDPGPAVYSIATIGSLDGFISVLDAGGALLTATGFGSAGSETTTGIAVSPSGQNHVTGIFSQTVDFDPGAGTSNLTSAGGTDAFALKFGPPQPAGINDRNSEKAAPSLHPNPAGDWAVLRFPSLIQDGNVRIISAAGSLVQEWRGVSGEELRVDLRGVAPGVYVVEVATDGAVQRMRLVKQ